MAADAYIKSQLLRPDELNIETDVQHDPTQQYGYFFIVKGATNKWGQITYGKCDCNRGLNSEGKCYFCER